MSVRAMMTLVLIVGGALGWTIHRVDRQRRSVTALRKLGAEVRYN
jgi:hypothetical protein